MPAAIANRGYNFQGTTKTIRQTDCANVVTDSSAHTLADRRRTQSGRGRAIHRRHDQENFRHTDAAAAKKENFDVGKKEIAHTDAWAKRDAEAVRHTASLGKPEEEAFAHSDGHASSEEANYAIADTNGDTSGNTATDSDIESDAVADIFRQPFPDGITETTRRPQRQPRARCDQWFRYLPAKSPATPHERTGIDHTRPHLLLRLGRSRQRRHGLLRLRLLRA